MTEAGAPTPLALALAIVLCVLANAGGTSLDWLLQRATLHYMPALPRSYLNKAITYTGDDTRLRRVVDKLIDGRWGRQAGGMEVER